MTKAELIKALTRKKLNLPCRIIDDSIKYIFNDLVTALGDGHRVEIRGFGSFSLRHRAQRNARNPKTGDKVTTKNKFIVHFKPGKELKNRVNITS